MPIIFYQKHYFKFSPLKKILTFALRVCSICLVLSGLTYPLYLTWTNVWYFKCHTETCWLFLFLTNGTIFANALLIISMDSISWLFWIFSAKTLHSLWVWSQVLSTVEMFQEPIKTNRKSKIYSMAITVVEFQVKVSKYFIA